MEKIMKSKILGVILAVLFGPFSWIYTYKIDSSKFWIGIILWIALCWTFVIPLGIWIWSIIDMASKDSDKFENYAKYYKA